MQFLANWLHVRRRGLAGPGRRLGRRHRLRRLGHPARGLRPGRVRATCGCATRPRPFDPARAQAWLDWFDAQQGRGGRVRPGHAAPRRARRPGGTGGGAAPAASSRRWATQVAAWFDRQDWLPRTPDLLGAHLVPRRRGLRLTQEADHDGDDWSVDRQVLTLTDGLRWAEEVDPVALALVSGADGTVPLRDQLAVLAAAFETPEPVLAAMAVPVVAHLVERGILLPAPA